MKIMQITPQGIRRILLGLLGIIWVAGFTACSKKTDPAAASSGGGVAAQRNVLTMKGAAQ
jgi:hypothetical protein